MNNIINKFLLAGDKFMPEMHLRQPQFTYSACGPFTKHKQRIQKFKETGDTNYIYKSELDKACFAHDATHSDSKDLIKRTVSSVKWILLAHLKSQPRGQNFQAQKPVERSSPHQTRINKNTKNTFKRN